MAFAHLPPELIFSIYQYLKPDDIKQLQLTCKKIYKSFLIKSNHLVLKLNHKTCFELDTYKNSYREFSNVYLESHYRFKDSQAEKNLRTLLSIPKFCGSIKHLTLNGLHLETAEIFFHLTKLSEIELTHVFVLNNLEFLLSLELCSERILGVTSLSIDTCDMALVKCFLKMKLNKLQKLHISNMSDYRETYGDLIELVKLNENSLMDIKLPLTTELILILPKLHITKLNLYEVPHVRLDVEIKKKLKDMLTCFQNLREIVLDVCDLNSYEILKQIFMLKDIQTVYLFSKNIIELKSDIIKQQNSQLLHLKFGNMIKIISFENILMNFPNLQTLALHNVDDKAVQIIIKNCKNLINLTLESSLITIYGFTGCDESNRKPIGYHISELNNLQSLIICDMDVSLSFFQNGKKLKNLKLLCFQSTYTVSDDYFSILLEMCPNIESLELVQSFFESNFVDNFCKFLNKKISEMKYVEVKFSNEGTYLEAVLREKRKDLSHIYCSRCEDFEHDLLNCTVYQNCHFCTTMGSIIEKYFH